MTDRIGIALALDALLTANESDQKVVELIELMRERHNEIIDVLTDPPSFDAKAARKPVG